MASFTRRTATYRTQIAALAFCIALLGLPPSTMASVPVSPSWQIRGYPAVLGPGVTFTSYTAVHTGNLIWTPQLVEPALALSSSGHIAAVWPGPAGLLAGVDSAPSASFTQVSQPPPSPPTSLEITGVSAAIDSHGDAIVSWKGAERYVPPEHAWRSGAASLTGLGTWQDLAYLEAPPSDYETAAPPSVAFDNRGDGFAVWTTPAHGPDERDEQVEASFMPAKTHVWQVPRAISPARPRVNDPQIAVDPGGGAIAVWTADVPLSGLTPRLEGSLRPAGGRWSSSAVLGRADDSEPMVAFRRGGEALVVWNEPEQSGLPMVFRPASLARVRWGASESLPGTDTQGTGLAREASGLATGRRGVAAVWLVTQKGGIDSLRVLMAAPGKGWSPGRVIASWPIPFAKFQSTETEALPTCRYRAEPFVAFDARDDAIAVWQDGCGASFTAVHPASAASWSRASALVGMPAGVAATFALGVAGELVAVWLEPGAVTVSGRFLQKQLETTVVGAVFRRAPASGRG
jgi:hypothetical protein